MRARFWRMTAFGVLTLMGCASGELPKMEAPAGETAARFEWFTYEGRDEVFEGPIAADEYRNPVLAGFYPDPSITRADEDYYLVNSTFAYFPGIPVFHSRDLVNWTQIGNVIDRTGMLDFSGLGLSRGVFAPTIEYHDGLFYVANTCVDCGGNFIVTAEDPAGPWSDPVWLPEVGGIDPSLFFDEDGKVYLMNNDAPVGEPRYEGHRAIWIREVDPETLQSVSEPIVLIDGGVRPEENPIWIEGPHIYHVGDYYYLSSAEGGTAINHSQVVMRAPSVFGPYTPYEGNPVLTQRHLPADREHPITSVGHADFVQDSEGNWWATFLGVRPYEGDYYNTGRETFLMPVEWKDGWPVITEGNEEVTYVTSRPPMRGEEATPPMAGNFMVREEFDGPLDPHWLFVRVPQRKWWHIEEGGLVIEPKTESLGDRGQPSLIVRRQQHLDVTAETGLRFDPEAGTEAGLVAMQSDEYYFTLGLGADENGQPVIRLRRRSGPEVPPEGEVMAETPVSLDADEVVRFRVMADGPVYRYSYAIGDGEFTSIGGEQDGKLLSTRQAGGFVGATIGMYAEDNR